MEIKQTNKQIRSFSARLCLKERAPEIEAGAHTALRDPSKFTQSRLRALSELPQRRHRSEGGSGFASGSARVTSSVARDVTRRARALPANGRPGASRVAGREPNGDK